jgi:hypothetical protein
MGLVLRLLQWLWRRISDINTAADLLDFFDLKTGLFAAVAFVAMMVLGATNFDWSAPGIVLAAILAGAGIAVIVIALRMILAARSTAQKIGDATVSDRKNLGGSPPIARPPAGFLDSSQAETRIRQRREWSDRIHKEMDESKREAICEEIRQLIREQARLGRIAIWGTPPDNLLTSTKIHHEHWKHFRIKEARSVIDWNNPGAASPADCYINLKIERAEFDKLYPPDESGGFAELTVGPPVVYSDLSLNAIEAALNELYREVATAEEIAISLDGINGSMEAILVQPDGRRIFLDHLDEHRLRMNETLGTISNILRRNGLYADEFPSVTNQYFEGRFWPAYNNLAEAVRSLTRPLNREELSIFLESRKAPFVEATRLFKEWATTTKTSLVNKRLWLSMKR